jgi:hypothetical protein
VTRKEFNDIYWLARRDHALWLHEHESMNYTQVAKHMGISQVSASRLCSSARFTRGDHRGSLSSSELEIIKEFLDKRMLST